jgi:maltokinase-like protein
VALIYKAELVPSKPAALAGWVPGRPWAAGVDASALTQVGSYRFDDPDGEVGIETLLLRAADGRLLQVPLTYRAAPLDGAADALVATMEHSVLGPRWAYDGCADPVAVRALVTAIRTGGQGAALEYDSGSGVRERREPTMRVAGSGSAGADVPAVGRVRAVDSPGATVVDAGGAELTVRRVVEGDVEAGAALRGTWPGQDEPVVLATLRDRPPA